MDEDDEPVAEVFAHFVFSVHVIRIIENILVPANIEFKTEFMALEVEDEDQITTIFTKIRYWIDNIVNRSIVFCHDNEYAIDMFVGDDGDIRSANNILLTPEEPSDQHLASLFQAKFQALAGKVMEFGTVEVKSDNQLGLQFTFVGNASAILPSMEEWVGGKTYFDKPWWERDDASTLDVMPPEDADLSVKPSWAFTFDFLKQPKKIETGGKIIRPEFRPKIIDGGKSEK